MVPATPIEDGVLVTFTAGAGSLAPTYATTTNGVASTTLSSSPETGRFTVRAEARGLGQQQPAVGKCPTMSAPSSFPTTPLR